MLGVIRCALPHSRPMCGFAGIALAVFSIQPSMAIDINPEVQTGPTVQRWGWDIKGSQDQTSTIGRAQLLYDDAEANLIRIPIFVNAHFSDGSVNASIYSNEIRSILNARAQNPDLEVFASIKLQGGSTFLGPSSETGWVTQATPQWQADTGSIFGNTVDKPNPEFYSQLVADFFDYMDGQGIDIDYIGLNNETERALDIPRYIDAVDRLKSDLTNRGYNTNDLKFVAPDTFNIWEAPNVLSDIINDEQRADTFDIVGSHQYPQFNNHTSDNWQDLSSITGGKDLWHTEVHMNASNNNNGGTANDNIKRLTEAMGIVFSANLNGVDSFVWWGSGHNTSAIGETLKREITKSTIDAHPIESPIFDEHDPAADAPIYQAYRKGDLVTLWIAYPEFADISSFPVDVQGGTIATEGSLTVSGEYWRGGSVAGTFGNTINAQSNDFHTFNVDGDNQGFSVDTIPENSISKIQFVMTGRLVWNQGSGNFDEGFARSNGFGQVGATGVDPFGHKGTESLYIGNGGLVTLDGTTSLGGGAVKSLTIGTNAASDIIEDRNGFGVLNANDSVSLTIGDGTPVSNGVGDFTVGDGGQQALVNWNSSGTLDIQGKFRIGQGGGSGQFTQTDGVVTAGSTGGSNKFISVGVGAGSLGIYQLNNGKFLPGGGLTGQFRELRIGSATNGQFYVGDGSGDAGSANIETRWQVIVGHNGGDGSLTIDSDGAITQVGSSSSLTLGNGGGQAAVTQLGGSVTSEHLLRIGVGSGSVGSYAISGGLLDITNIGSGEIRVGENGATGTLTVEGAATVNASADLVIADTDDAGTVGLLEILGSDASISIGKLGNATGNDETLRWVADDMGISPLTVRGDIGNSLYVELQSPAEIALNLGGVGDGIGLDLDLSALSTLDTQLTLIDNLAMEAIQGYFENPLIAGDLYEEGDSIEGTGFDGTVTISYVGGTGNDVVLNLMADSLGENADFDADLDVDGADFLTWQRGLGSAGGLGQGDANGNGLIDQADFAIWQNQYAAGTALGATAAIPEPSSMALALVFSGIITGWRRSYVSQ